MFYDSEAICKLNLIQFDYRSLWFNSEKAIRSNRSA